MQQYAKCRGREGNSLSQDNYPVAVTLLSNFYVVTKLILELVHDNIHCLLRS